AAHRERLRAQAQRPCIAGIRRARQLHSTSQSFNGEAQPENSMEYVIGVDIGGTCTDCVVLDPEGKLTIGKAFSTPPDFATGVLDAVRVAGEALSLEMDELLAHTRLFLHATTMADNAVVEGNLARGGMLVTRG